MKKQSTKLKINKANNIWEQLPRPFFALAPMDDVTDTAFRRLITTTAKPDIFFTEFASVDGLNSSGRSQVMKKLKFTPAELPLIAQVWGLDPENYYKSAQELVEMGFSGIDINMGCPVKKVIKIGACSALINNRSLAQEIIQATIEGVGGRIPISVKTRLGFKNVDLSWIEFLLSQKIDALTIHGRTSTQMSTGKSNWELIGESRKLRDKINPKTVIIGNGDVLTRIQGLKYAKQYKLDGVMIGRGVFQDPYVFSRQSRWAHINKYKKIELYHNHINLFIETWGNQKNPATLKKFAKVYISGFKGASELRSKLMDANTASELIDILELEKTEQL